MDEMTQRRTAQSILRAVEREIDRLRELVDALTASTYTDNPDRDAILRRAQELSADLQMAIDKARRGK